VVFTAKILFGPKPPTIHHSFQRFTSGFFSIELLGALIRQVREASNHRNPRMSFKQDAGESIAESMLSGTRSLGFSNSYIRPSPRHGIAYRIISLHASIMTWRSGSSSKSSIMG
jgi:hypothetical protein